MTETHDDHDEEREAYLAALASALSLGDEELLERAYLFDSIARRDTAFGLALVTKRVAPDRLEMIALGNRAEGSASPERDFIRRARFPDGVLSEILGEFIERCGVEGATYREVALGDHAGDADPIEALADLLAGKPDA